jgi:hypothetical protein
MNECMGIETQNESSWCSGFEGITLGGYDISFYIHPESQDEIDDQG